MDYDWQWSIVWEYRYALLQGAELTFIVSFISICFGTIIGILWGIALSSKDTICVLPQKIAFLTADIIRALPPLILLLLINYYAPPAIGLHSKFWLSVIALSLNLSAFIADVLRGSIAGIQRPLIDAGLAVGMSNSQITRRIVLPEAIRGVIPTFTLLYIDILKMSSLASVIALQELTHIGSQISGKEFKYLEIIVAVALIYIIIVLPLTWFQRWLESSRSFRRRS